MARTTYLTYRSRFHPQTAQSCASTSAWYVALSFGKSEGQTQPPWPAQEGRKWVGKQASVRGLLQQQYPPSVLFLQLVAQPARDKRPETPYCDYLCPASTLVQLSYPLLSYWISCYKHARFISLFLWKKPASFQLHPKVLMSVEALLSLRGFGSGHQRGMWYVGLPVTC